MRKLGNLVAAALAIVGIICLINSCTFRSPTHDQTMSKPAPAPGYALTPSPRVTTAGEIRGVWVSDTTKLDWDSATENLRRAGFNTIYANLASGGAAFYPNSHAMPSVVRDFSDPVAHGIDLAHERGLAVDAKQIVTFMYKAPPWFQHELVAQNRVMRGPDGHLITQSGYTWLCPSVPANRALVESSVAELVKKYPVDGIQFDYIRFCEQPCCFCDNCRREFEQSIGTRVRHWPADVMGGRYTMEFNVWRQREITAFVQQLSSRARLTRPGLAVSAAVFPELDRAKEEKAQDWKTWLDRGYVDYVCTMTYTPDLREFATRIRKEQMWASQRNKVVVGIGSWKFDRMSQLTAQIGATRQLGAPGFVLFSYDDSAARNFLPELGGATAKY
ncbi:MAG TPA: family 10 glycosylhydrolase [Verrucomicrobiae bacterium]|nr:family 10 glycosylhydrolase [Verrucomicrobiae bacterium]